MTGRSALQSGERFADRFAIASLLASGRRGHTYAARDSASGTDVALLQVLVMLSERQQRALDQVSRTLMSVQHPGLVRSLGCGLVDQRPWFASELLSGRSLEQELAQRGQVAMRRAASVASQVAKALAVAHDAQLFHRSLKPSNLFLVGDDQSDSVVVLDLGVAAVLCSDGRSIATPQLCAPEESTGAAVDGRTDIYSLGCLLFQMLTGRPPFEAATAAELQQAHRQQSPPRLRAIKASAEPLQAIVNRMLAKRPGDRFQSMSEVATALDEILAAPASPLQVDASDPAPDPSPSGQPKTWQVAGPPEAVSSVPEKASSQQASAVSPSVSDRSSRPKLSHRVPWAGILLVAVSTVVAFLAGLWWANR